MKSPRITLHRVRKDGYLPQSTQGKQLILFRILKGVVVQKPFYHYPAFTSSSADGYTHFIIQPTTYDLAPVSPKRRKKSQQKHR